MVSGLLFTTYYISHVSYLSLWKFDYGYNIAAGVVFGLLSMLVWVYWFFKTRPPHGNEILIAYGCLMAGMLFELFDFPPLFLVLDAHAVWHLSTIPTTYLFYSFFIKDAMYQIANDNKLN